MKLKNNIIVELLLIDNWVKIIFIKINKYKIHSIYKYMSNNYR